MRDGWIDRANCKGMDTEMFFHNAPNVTAMAQEVCKTCPVVVECLTYCLQFEAKSYSSGVWGGMTAKERARRRGNVNQTIP